MIPIDLRLDGNLGMTLLSNAFIDNYMKYANDAEIKVYLYLLRNLSAGRSVDITSMADCFNYSEKDIIRALLYWERWGVLSLVYDPEKRASGEDYAAQTEKLVGIRLAPLFDSEPEPVCRVRAEVPAAQTLSRVRAEVPAAKTLCQVGVVSTAVSSAHTGVITSEEDSSAAEYTGAVSLPSFDDRKPSDIKASYTLDDMRSFKSDPACGFLYTAAQQYLGRPLTDPQMRSILFMTRELHFSPELTDYLLQYCIGDGHKDFHYIEGTALAWSEQGITTPEEARSATRSSEEDERIRSILSMLGRSGKPAPQELRFIRRWLNSYAFSMEIIEDACNRTVCAVDKNRFAYAESILAKWHEKGVREKKDIAALDAEYQKSRGIPEKPQGSGRRVSRSDQFNRFEQRDFDYDSIEHLLTGSGDGRSSD